MPSCQPGNADPILLTWLRGVCRSTHAPTHPSMCPITHRCIHPFASRSSWPAAPTPRPSSPRGLRCTPATSRPLRPSLSGYAPLHRIQDIQHTTRPQPSRSSTRPSQTKASMSWTSGPCPCSAACCTWTQTARSWRGRDRCPCWRGLTQKASSQTGTCPTLSAASDSTPHTPLRRCCRREMQWSGRLMREATAMVAVVAAMVTVAALTQQRRRSWVRGSRTQPWVRGRRLRGRTKCASGCWRVPPGTMEPRACLCRWLSRTTQTSSRARGRSR